MIIIDTPEAMRDWSDEQHRQHRSLGFVPTMGALHEGHLSLARAAVQENSVAVASIFVNPKQFAPNEDYSRYPRTFDEDVEKLETEKVTAVYAPIAKDLYPEAYSTYVTVENVSEGLCGGSRPHFFRGVATVVLKLFNAVKPDRAYFGQKDAQQCAVIKRMTRDLDMGIEVIEMPIVREDDGLAMSSRNRYLGTEDRQRALSLSRALDAARHCLDQGERNAAAVVAVLRDAMSAVDIDYTAVVDAETMRPVEAITRPILVAVAAQLPTTRLIDNFKYEPSPRRTEHPEAISSVRYVK